MVLRTSFMAAKRLPAIRFRFGANASAAGSAPPPCDVSSPAGAKATGRAPAIEDWELPARYHRKPIDKFEMEYINRGGPE